jgi:probable HAF family extracellular repeat protein
MHRVPVKPFLLFSLLTVPLTNIFLNAGGKRAGARAGLGPRKRGLSLFFLTAILVAGLTATPPAAVAQEYEIINLDPQGTGSYAYGINSVINSDGQIAGRSRTAAGEDHAFLWQIAGCTSNPPGNCAKDLGTLGGNYSEAFAINSGGQVVGHSLTESGVYQAFLWSEQNGTEAMQDLGKILGSDSSVANAINNAGQIVGNYIPANSESGSAQAFLLTPETKMDLGTLGGGYSSASAINSNSNVQVVGVSATTEGNYHAFLWQQAAGVGAMQDLGTLGGNTSQANAINDKGQVVGGSETDKGENHAFLWTEGVMQDLGTLGGSESEAFAINSGGQVVGYSTTADEVPHAFFWPKENCDPQKDNCMQDLGTLGGDFSSAEAINDKGQIAGSSQTADGKYLAVLWQVVTVKDQQGPVVEHVEVTPNPSPVNGPIVLKAVVDDTNSGNSTIYSAEYSIDGENWIAMHPADGTFDSPVETVVADLNAPAAAGISKLYVRGIDIYGNVGEKERSLLAVYKPGCGFLTGGGRFHSHPGAFRRNLKLWGKAVFGFVSKHERWDTQATDRPEFQFNLPGLDFHSANYDWLVADEGGLGAQLKGLGRINGIGNYHFMLWANDGTSEDFRVRIWHEDAAGKETVVYDNDQDQTIEKGKIILSNQ